MVVILHLFSVDDWEAKREGWEKTADVIDYMTKKCKQKYSGL